MQIIVVRHGETDFNKTRIFQGQQQIPLNGKGSAQAREVAAILRQYPITHIYCSGLERARETAEIIDKSFLLPIEIDNRINFPRPYGRGFHGLNFVALHLEGKRKMQGELHPSTLRSGILVR